MTLSMIRLLFPLCIILSLCGCRQGFVSITDQQAKELSVKYINPKKFSLEKVYFSENTQAIRIEDGSEQNTLLVEEEGSTEKIVVAALDIENGYNLIIIDAQYLKILTLAKISSQKITLMKENYSTIVENIRKKYGIQTKDNSPVFEGLPASTIIKYYNDIVTNNASIIDTYIYKPNNYETFIESYAYRKRTSEEEFTADYNAAKTKKERGVIAEQAISFWNEQKSGDDDYAKRIYWLQKAEENNKRTVANRDANSIDMNKTNTSSGYQKYVVECTRVIADGGDSKAQYGMALLYHNGKFGVDKDQVKAYEYLLAAKENGYPVEDREIDTMQTLLFAQGLYDTVRLVGTVTKPFTDAMSAPKATVCSSDVANALNMDCSLAGELGGFCRTGECHLIEDELARNVCIAGPNVLLSYEFKDRYTYLYEFIEHGAYNEKFGQNRDSANRLRNTSKQARTEFVIYHLSGMRIF